MMVLNVTDGRPDGRLPRTYGGFGEARGSAAFLDPLGRMIIAGSATANNDHHNIQGDVPNTWGSTCTGYGLDIYVSRVYLDNSLTPAFP